ncbi:MAG: dienelactone hydrolase family protein [Herminiimonas sp.]|nr:dienelactone hydrolase family protein [Herminiimonas sp.]
MTSRTIDLTSHDGKTFQGYLALPPAGTGPGIVLIQEIFGVNAHIRAVADQYALDGYVVLAPDLFWRMKPGVELGYDETDFGAALGYMQKMDFALAIQDLSSTVAALKALPECTGKVASLGYCMGGLLSYQCAANAGVDAAVCYYPGSIEQHLGQVAKVHCPILIHFAGQDHYIPAAAVKATQEAFKDAHNAVIEVYAGVDHGFNCWERPSYDQKASSLAHGLSLSFLAKAY